MITVMLEVKCDTCSMSETFIMTLEEFIEDDDHNWLIEFNDEDMEDMLTFCCQECHDNYNFSEDYEDMETDIDLDELEENGMSIQDLSEDF